MSAFKSYSIVILFILSVSCNRTEQYKSDLNKNSHPTVICKAANKLGKARDTSAIKLLLSNILDGRMSTNLQFKGMTVCYCKLIALKKITGIEPIFKINQFTIDTSAVKYYLNFLIQKRVLAGEK